MKRLFCVLTAVIFLLSGVPAFAEDAREQTDESKLIEDLILYYECHGEAAAEEVNTLLGTLKETDITQGELWEDIMDYWKSVNTDYVIHTQNLPEGLQQNKLQPLTVL